jgi:hypothetical protein
MMAMRLTRVQLNMPLVCAVTLSSVTGACVCIVITQFCCQAWLILDSLDL